MRRIRYNNVMILGIGIYIVFNLTNTAIGKTVNTLVLEETNTQLKIQGRGLIIREEYLLTSKMKGNLNFLAKDKEKVKTDDEIAYIEEDTKLVKKNDEEIEGIYEELDDLEKSLEQASSNIEKKVLDNQIKEREEQIQIINRKNNQYIHHIDTPVSGILSYEYDNNESKYNLNNLKEITKEDIENIQNEFKKVSTENVKEKDIVGRIIKDNNIYIAVSLDEEEKKKIENSRSISLYNSNMNINCKIYDIYQKEDYFIIIFKVGEENKQIYDTRVEEFDIIYRQVESLKIPRDSTIEENGKMGVYVIDEENKKSKFVELKGIQHQDDEFIYLDYFNNKISGIDSVTLYDEIILKPNIINTNIKIK